MRSPLMLAIAAVSVLGGVGLQKSQRRFNPVVEVLAQKKPVFGLYAPAIAAAAAARPPPADAPPPKTPAQLAQEAIGNTTADYHLRRLDGRRLRPRVSRRSPSS